MVTRPQIEKLSARVDALVAASEGGVVFIWRDPGQTEMEACECHYRCRPEDRRASRTYVIGWIEGE
jgi:hypothetical protein